MLNFYSHWCWIIIEQEQLYQLLFCEIKSVSTCVKKERTHTKQLNLSISMIVQMKMKWVLTCYITLAPMGRQDLIVRQITFAQKLF